MEQSKIIDTFETYHSHKVAVASLSHRWSLIRPHPVCRWKGRMCIVSPFDGAEATRPDLWYPPFSLTKLRRGRAFATCSLVTSLVLA